MHGCSQQRLWQNANSVADISKPLHAIHRHYTLKDDEIKSTNELLDTTGLKTPALNQELCQAYISLGMQLERHHPHNGQGEFTHDRARLTWQTDSTSWEPTGHAMRAARGHLPVNKREKETIHVK